MEYILKTNTNINKPFQKFLNKNVEGEHRKVKAVCFLCE